MEAFAFLQKEYRELSEEVSERQRLIISYLRRHGEIDRQNCLALLSISERTVVRDLNELIGKGVLEKQGQGKSTRYYLR